MQYRTKTSIIKAIQYDGDNSAEIVVKAAGFVAFDTDAGVLIARTRNGSVPVNPDDYVIIRSDEAYPCPPNVFDEKYESDVPVQTYAWREVLDHRVEGKGGGADDTRVFVMDEPGQGGASHEYVVTGSDGNAMLRVNFQNGPIQEHGVNGSQQEHLLAIVIDRLRSFQAGPFANRYNALALTKCEEALMWLQRRTVDRIRRGVEGYNKA